MASTNDGDLYYYVDLQVRARDRADRAPPPRHFRFPRFGGKSDPPSPTRTSTLTFRASRIVQGVTQGPYPWESMDQWLIAKFISLDLMVNRAGESGWITLGEMVARRRAEAQGARSRDAAGAGACPRPLPSVSTHPPRPRIPPARPASPPRSRRGTRSPWTIASRA